MGYTFFDKYSLLHFAAGIIAYYWNIDLYTWMFIHILFEVIENTPFGISFINTFFKDIWPGGKEMADKRRNSFGDIFFGILGWYVAYLNNLNL